MGNRVQEQVLDANNASAQARTREYDALNRLNKDIGGANPLAEITRYGYDNQGNLLSITDPLGHVTNNLYDALNRLKQTIDPAAAGPGSGGVPTTHTTAWIRSCRSRTHEASLRATAWMD